ncbi:MAG: NADH:ubiquinone reductase (Na(+)-transporting) subunit C [Bacteroidales bacterium]
MKTNSNTYTIIYATVLVIIVATILTLVSTSLKPKQQKNIEINKKQAILNCIGLGEKTDQIKDVNLFIEKEFKNHLVEMFLVNNKGERIKGNAFKMPLKEQYDIMRLKESHPEELALPVYIFKLLNGKKITVFSTYGAGLWGPIWGYISLNEDLNTFYGSNFDHKSETPGLGARIAEKDFQNQFIGKKIFDNNSFCSIDIVKGGADKSNEHEIDAISGATITSTALKNCLGQWLRYYLPYIQKTQASQKVLEETQSLEINNNNNKEENNE